VSLQARASKHRGCRAAFGGATIGYGESATAIEFPEVLLSHRLAERVDVHPDEDPKPLPEDFAGRVQLVLEFLLRQGNADVESLAALVGTSRRTLQRHLLERGETFSGILDRVRSDRARRLLEDSSIKVIDVAYEVGYSDPAHFARAFRRWTGLAPRAYRGSCGSMTPSSERIARTA